METDLSQATGRNLLIERVRGIGILLVVFGHSLRGVRDAGIAGLTRAQFDVTYSVIYTFHMPLFFLLAGLFFTRSLEKRGVGAFLGDKFQRLAYPYVVWSLIQGAIELVLARYTNRQAHLGDLFGLFAYPRDQFWFLYVLFIVNAVASLYFAGKVKERYAFALLFIASLLFNFVPITAPWVLGQICHFAFFFVLGICLGPKLIAREPSKIVSWSLIGVFAVTQYLFHAQFGWDFESAPTPVLMVMALIGIAATVGVASIVPSFCRGTLTLLGRYSLEIYLVHIIVASGTRIALAKIGFHGGALAYTFIVTIAATFICLAFAMFCAKRGWTWVFSFPARGRQIVAPKINDQA